METAQRWFPPLPRDWEARFDPSQNRYFFMNHKTRATQWEDPRFPTSTASSAVASLSPSNTPSRPASTAQSYQMRELSSPSRTAAAEQMESDLSGGVDQAILEKLHKEFPKASKEIIADMLSSCYNNERQTREHLTSIGFSQQKVTSPTNAQSPPAASSAQASNRENSQSEKQKVHSQMRGLYPSLSDDIIRMTLEVVKYDASRGKAFLRNIIETQRTNPSTRGTSSSRAASSASPAREAAVLEPQGLTASTSNQPQGISGATSVTLERSATRQPQQFTNTINITNNKRSKLTSTSKKQVVTHQPRQADRPRHAAQQPAQPPATTSRTPTMAQGPDPALSRGPDRSLLSNDPSMALGPDLSLRQGPDPTLSSGRDRSLVNGPGGAKGPDRSFCCGPQLALTGTNRQLLVTQI